MEYKARTLEDHQSIVAFTKSRRDIDRTCFRLWFSGIAFGLKVRESKRKRRELEQSQKQSLDVAEFRGKKKTTKDLTRHIISCYAVAFPQTRFNQKILALHNKYYVCVSPLIVFFFSLNSADG
jgi:hypothetical protein